ncbi:uncharacterized protein LOC131333728 isoform X1 [Rhododendron vialii]|uniref:uncharacterized protein LOC131333728 isoform X1 n=1 Tax=Rhododendron vialii TaxID=182163 RepID=UPI00265E6868|nr:uncharacterized protein LOC131333728 isoform X1 [Rhododendron vialii]XP_058224418.1 uncharacterized protein LOC131333728 isoform X1 [Rhododendron vialii]
MPQNHLRPLKRAMAIEEAEISSGKFMEKASVEGNPPRFGSNTYEVGESKHNHLKEVEVGGFYGTEAQIGFLMKLVKYAVMLERMVVNTDAEIRRGIESRAGIQICIRR